MGSIYTVYLTDNLYTDYSWWNVNHFWSPEILNMIFFFFLNMYYLQVFFKSDFPFWELILRRLMKNIFSLSN